MHMARLEYTKKGSHLEEMRKEEKRGGREPSNTSIGRLPLRVLASDSSAARSILARCFICNCCFEKT